MKFAFILAENVNYTISALCRVLGVARSGYHAWTGREPSGQRYCCRECAEVRRVV